MSDLPAPWLGGDYTVARWAQNRAIDEGMSRLRAVIVGNVASFVDGWASRKRLAKQARCSLRTVQRALTEAAELGLIGKARAKMGERMPGMKPGETQTCGFSHRWTIGRGLAAAAAAAAVAAARVARLVRAAVEPKHPPAKKAAAAEKRPKTAEELAERRELLRAQARQLLDDEREPPPD